MQTKQSDFTKYFLNQGRLPESVFIRAMHPKTEILPRREAIGRVLRLGWWGQVKIHGHRAQIHIPADPETPLILYTRKGSRHSRALPGNLEEEVRRVFRPDSGWNVIDTEWLKAGGRLFVFDFLKKNGQVLSDLTYEERRSLLPQVYGSASVETLPVLVSLDACMEALESPEPWVEGLVFKAKNTPGFQDTSVIRCRKPEINP